MVKSLKKERKLKVHFFLYLLHHSTSKHLLKSILDQGAFAWPFTKETMNLKMKKKPERKYFCFKLMVLT